MKRPHIRIVQHASDPIVWTHNHLTNQSVDGQILHPATVVRTWMTIFISAIPYVASRSPLTVENYQCAGKRLRIDSLAVVFQVPEFDAATRRTGHQLPSIRAELDPLQIARLHFDSRLSPVIELMNLDTGPGIPNPHRVVVQQVTT